MGLFKRAIASISRRMGKSVMLLILVFILGTLIVGGASIQRAVMNTEENLRRSMPPITSIEFDWGEWMANYNHRDDYIHWNLTADVVRQIGALPYVSHFNYSITTSIQNFDFVSYDVAIEGNVGVDRMEGFPNFLGLTGVSRPEIVYIEQGLIELVAGRTFEEHEMTGITDVIPIVMSRPLADANNLSVESIFTLYDTLGNHFDHHGAEAWYPDHAIASIPYTFKVIGLFDMIDRRTDLLASNDEDFNEWNAQWGQLNTTYVPSRVAEEINRVNFEANRDFAIESGFEEAWFNPDEEYEARMDALFILGDSLEVDNFRAAVDPLIPAYYRVADLSNSFANMQSSMETMLWIADIVLIVAIIATVLILSLIITLFLRDRRYEMGIYLALGEKKLKVTSQIIVEVVATAIIGITLAIFIGSIASTQITQMMLRNHLVAQVEPEARIMGFDGTRSLETLGFLAPMSPDEMMASFDVSLDVQTIGLLYGIGVITVIVSTLAPVGYVIRLNPKKILLEAKS